jgi:hypothetical protein
MTPPETLVGASTENGRHHTELFQMPIQDRVARVVRHALCHSLDFLHIGESWERYDYVRKHQTPVSALMCMDGCVSISRVTKVPWGIIQPFRHLGGRLNLGWSHLGELVTESVLAEATNNRTMLCLVTYHYSKSDPHRGCAGFGYGTDEARTHAFSVVRQLERCFGGTHRSVYPLVVGLETDQEALLFHDVEDKEVLDLSDVPAADDYRLVSSLSQLYPEIPEYILADLMPLVTGNLSHIADTKRKDKSNYHTRHEWIICLGHGFGWLQQANQALIIGPYGRDLRASIHTAATIIEANMQSGRIPDDGFLLLTEAPYREQNGAGARAELESRYLAQCAADVVHDNHPALATKMHTRSLIRSRETDGITLVESSPQNLTNQAPVYESYTVTPRQT